MCVGQPWRGCYSFLKVSPFKKLALIEMPIEREEVDVLD
jgi:hypothetical protein